jgi:polyisoprenoid-binding protein YceI
LVLLEVLLEKIIFISLTSIGDFIMNSVLIQFCQTLFALSCSLLLSFNVATATGFNLTAKGAKAVKLDNALGKNQVKFSSKAPLENIDGTATVNGTFTLDPANIEGTTGRMAIPVVSMQTGVELRDQHLRGKDWLDADANKDITFDVKKISGVQVTSSGNGKGVAKGIVDGVVTLHGIPKSVSVPVEIIYLEKPSADVVMITTEFNISLKDHKIEGKRGIVGSKVGETIIVKVSLFGSTGA